MTKTTVNTLGTLVAGIGLAGFASGIPKVYSRINSYSQRIGRSAAFLVALFIFTTMAVAAGDRIDPPGPEGVSNTRMAGDGASLQSRPSPSGASYVAGTQVRGAASTDTLFRVHEYNVFEATGFHKTSTAINSSNTARSFFATYFVTNTNDSGVGSLRSAIEGAIVQGGTINFAFGGAAKVTILLNSALPALSNEVDILNTTGTLVTVSGPTPNGFCIFRINLGARVNISNLIITNGRQPGNLPGAGIYNGGTLTVTGSRISDGYALLTGAGIYNEGTLTVRRSTISNNLSYFSAGGIYNRGTATILDSTIDGNTVYDGGFFGGIFMSGGGGGIVNDLDAVLTLTGSTISNNKVNGNSFGGGMHNLGTAVVNNSTITGNSASVGGGIMNNTAANTLTVINSTISRNSANTAGGLANPRPCPPIFYGPFGCINVGEGSTTLRSSIIAQNTAFTTTITPDLDGVFISEGYNLIGEAKYLEMSPDLSILTDGAVMTATTGDQLGTTVAPIDAKLASLQYSFNGALTKTMELLGGSPAIDKGKSFGSTTDQRGMPRPINLDNTTYPNAVGGDGSDIGAFESQNAPLPDNYSSFVVTKVDDTNDGVCDAVDCSLREAMTAAENDSGKETITFNIPGDSPQTIQLSSYLPPIFEDLDILNTSGKSITVRGNGLAGGFNIFNFLGPIVNISGLTIANGSGLDGDGVAGGYLYPGGGIYNAGRLTVTNCTISNNSSWSAGGIYSYGGSLTLINSTVSNNSATVYGGGGIYIEEGSTLTVLNSTISNNSAQDSGGGIFMIGNMPTITNSTVSNNSSQNFGGGIYNGNGIASLRSSIIAGNTAANGGPDLYRTFTTAGYNLVGDKSGATITATTGDQFGTSNAPIDPKLGQLADNGGHTQTLALLTGSPAIDKGKSFGSNTDQRGLTRPRDLPDAPYVNATGGDGADIGAFEAQANDDYSSFVVTKTADTNDGLCGADCSLREAIKAANADAGKETITFNIQGPGAQIIQLASELPALSEDVDILNTSGKSITVNGEGAADPYRIFAIKSGITVKISDLTISNGSNHVNGFGASDGSGAGIFNEGGTLTVTNSTIKNNSAIFGGGILNFKGTLTVSNSTIGNNSATYGGGLYNFGGTLIITNSTISDNSGTYAGVFNAEGPLTVTNSTISGNSGVDGGGIFNFSGTATLRSSIVAKNTATSTGPDVSGTLSSSGYNLVGNNTGATITATTGDQFGTTGAAIDPKLGPLQDNGGPTQTFALLAGSPAIDKGKNFGLTIDQRGLNRPVDLPDATYPNASSGDGSDIGAFETQTAPVSSPVVTTNPGNQSVTEGQTATFSAAASGSPAPTVQWQLSTNGGAFSNIGGATNTTYSFTASAGQSGNKYQAVFTNATGGATTTAATLTVNTPPTVTTNPSNQTVNAGQTATFTAAASGSPIPSIQWQASINGGAFSNIAGATAATYSFTASLAQSGNQYRAVFTNAAGTATTAAGTLAVNQSPTITSADHTTFTVAAAGNFTVTTAPGFPTATTISKTGTLPSGVSFTDNGNGTATMAGTPAASTGGGYTLTIKASNGINPDASQSFTLTVNQAPSISTNPIDKTVNGGQTATFTAAGSGFPTPGVQWQVSTNGGAFSDIAGATSMTYSFTAALGQTGNNYRAVFTNIAGSATTTAATLTVTAAPVVTTSPSDQTVNEGQTATFTAAASGVPVPTGQWQVSTNGGAFSNVSGATNTTLSFTTLAAQSGNQYRAVFTNSQGNATTNAATLTVIPANDAPVNTVPGAQTVGISTDLVFSNANGNSIAVVDVDAGSGNVTVILSVVNGKLTLAATAGLTLTGNGTSAVQLTGTLANINAALNGLRFRNNTNFIGSDTLTIATNDNGNTGWNGALTDTDTVAITVSCVVSPVTVTNSDDDGAGSLRRAVRNICPGGTVNFDAAVTGAIQLSSGQIVIDKDLTIHGPSVASLAIQNAAAPSATSRVFNVTSAVTAAIDRLTLTAGNTTTSNGGGVNNDGTLTLTNVTITGNTAGSSASFGGGIANQGILTVVSSTISGNTAGARGGAVSMVDGGTVQITNSTLSGNTSSGGSAIFSQGVTAAANLTVTNSTISGNIARAGSSCPGIWNLTNGATAAATLKGSTITNNSGGTGGGAICSAGATTIGDTIVAGNPNGTSVPGDVSGLFASLGYNLIGNADSATGFAGVGDQKGTGVATLNAQLGSLGNNGGPTLTHALQPGSPAIDKGNCLTCAAPPNYDQRGVGATFTRPFDLSYASNTADGSDIGAFELHNLPPTNVLAGGPYTISEGQGLNLTGSATDPDNDPITYSWDVNGDGTFGDASTASPTLTWAQLQVLGIVDGPRAITTLKVRVSDGINPAVDSATATLTVNNAAPTATFNNGGAVNEGSTGSVSFTAATDASAPDVSAGLHYSFDFDNNGTYEVGDGTYAGSVTQPMQTVPASFFADGPGTRTVKGVVIDRDGGSTAYTTVIQINNVPPTATLSNGGAVTEGSTGSVSFTGAADVSAADTSAGFRYAFDFDNNGTYEVGDGTYAGSVTQATQTVPASFLADGPATRTVKGVVIDKDGGSTPYTTTIQINNVPPTLGISGGATVTVGKTYTLNLSSQDPGQDTVLSWTIKWGDGNTQVVNGNPLSVTHVYPTAGVFTISATATDEDGTYPAGNTVTVRAIAPPTITKQFGSATMPRLGTTTLTLQISNQNSGLTLTGIGFTDNLPAGLVVATPNGLTGNTCTTTPTAAAGTAVVSLAGATLAPGASCTFTVNVFAAQAGVQNNVTGNITSTESGPGGTASATITSVAPANIAKVFGSQSVIVGGTTSLQFALANPNATVPLSGLSFTDTLPAGMVVSTPNGLTGNTCSVAPTATAGSGSVSISGATLAANASCVFTVNVTSTTAGLKVNNTGPITSNEGGTGSSATAILNVLAPPVIQKQFGAVTIALNGTTTVSFIIGNPQVNPGTLTGVGFTDTLPAGMIVANPANISNTCNGSVTALPDGGSITLANGSVVPPPGTNCIVSVDIKGTTAGTKVNSVQVTSSNGGTGNTATATLNVGTAPAFEGDAAPRPNGDGKIQSDDVVQVQRFQIGLDTIFPGSDEFKRADSAPLNTQGDGTIKSDDVVQTQRFQIGLDPMQNAAGPELAINETDLNRSVADIETQLSEALKAPEGETRSIRIDQSETKHNGLALDVLVDAVGDESAYGFTLNYDPKVMYNPILTASIGRAICNVTTPGQMICSVSGFANDRPGSSTDQIGEIHSGHDQLLLRISFSAVPGSDPGERHVTIATADASNDGASNLEIMVQVP